MLPVWPLPSFSPCALHARLKINYYWGLCMPPKHLCPNVEMRTRNAGGDVVPIERRPASPILTSDELQSLTRRCADNLHLKYLPGSQKYIFVPTAVVPLFHRSSRVLTTDDTMDALFSIPFLSLLFLPALSSYSTSLNILFFYMTWTTLVLSHPPLRVELFGSAAVRLLFHALPSFIFFLFDILLPSTAVAVKAQGEAGLPGGEKRRTLRVKQFKVAGWSLFNLCFSLAAQAAIESLLVRGFGVRSAIKVSMKLPMPWGMTKDVFFGLVVREVSRSPG